MFISANRPQESKIFENIRLTRELDTTLFLFGAWFPNTTANASLLKLWLSADTATDASFLERWCPTDGEATAISFLELEL
jgi:hypothetical protein